MTTLARIVPDSLAVQARTVARHPAARLGVLVLAAVAAFNFTLWTLVRGLTVDSPMAYLGLVPFLALGMGVVLARPSIHEPAIHDRYLDWIVAVPMIGAALAANYALPKSYSTMFWVWRVDLLTFPLFIAGAVALLFGTRMLWRVRWAVLFLLLAWPVPLRTLLVLGLDGFTKLTSSAVMRLAAMFKLAEVVNADGAHFRIFAPDGPFDVVVASACSGANSLLGFMVVLPAMLLFVHGDPSRIRSQAARSAARAASGQAPTWRDRFSFSARMRKVAWVFVGLAFVWLGNLTRLMILLATGKYFGQKVAMDYIHPYLGLVLFMVSMFVMVALVPRFGLMWRAPTAGRVPVRSTFEAIGHNWKIPAACIVAVAVLLLGLNVRLEAVTPIAGTFGEARIAKYNSNTVRIPGFKAVNNQTFTFAKQFFGQDSTWRRYVLAGQGSPVLASPNAIFADVITTSDLQTFDDFDIQACYNFHGYKVSRPVEFDLGHGVVGHMIVWTDPKRAVDWTTVYWFWPINDNGKTRFQRTALITSHQHGALYTAPKTEASADIVKRLGAWEKVVNTPEQDSVANVGKVPTKDFMVAFARAMVGISVERTN